MNVSELHDLYAPLWKREPATRPNRDSPIDFLGIHPEFTANFAWLHICDNPCCKGFSFAKPVLVPYLEGAALCRVAVEDWLHTQSVEYFRARERVANEPCMIGFLHHGEPVGGSTIHHALVAVANAALDAREKK